MVRSPCGSLISNTLKLKGTIAPVELAMARHAGWRQVAALLWPLVDSYITGTLVRAILPITNHPGSILFVVNIANQYCLVSILPRAILLGQYCGLNFV